MKFGYGAAVMAVALLCANTAAAATLAEGTELPVRLNEKLSSKTSAEGDRFTITLAEDVKLSDGTILKEGYRGVGEITTLQKSGMVGKSGQLSLKLNYLKVGETRVKLRAVKGAEGKGNTGNMVVGLFFGGVFGLLIKGHSAEIPKGQMITAYADEDAQIDTPLPAPPSPEV